MTKYIHYCWFGNKPLPKLAKKCIKSWQKYLPEYKIIKWSEENVDLNECTFIKEAYENKKWAFVSDYVRTKALNEMGGIYFDTDMEVTKDISKLLNNETFLGVEDTGYVAVGVWFEKNKNSFLTNELLKVYRTFDKFDTNKIKEFSIPILISKILNNYGFKKGGKNIQILKDNIYIYPRDYFYPYSYSWENNLFTDNTCMIHYYDASWIPLKDKIEINMVRKIGKRKTYKVLDIYRKFKDYTKKATKLVLFPIVLLKKWKRKKDLINNEYLNRIDNTKKSIINNSNKNYVVFYNGNWLGVTSATKELFENLIDCGEIYRRKDIKEIGNVILDSNINQIIFSSFAIGWKDLAIYLKKHDKNIMIKTYWHGSHSQVLDEYGWQRNKEIIKLHNKKIVNVMGTCKESLVNFYKNAGYDTQFLTNKVTLKKNIKEEKKDEVVIGLYAAKCDDWRKNMFSQMAAVSLIEDAIIDMVPLNETALEFAKILNVGIKGTNEPLPREKLIDRMSKNSLNLYVTYSECAPMLPLESMEMGTICITGNNHHYFKNNELEKYLVVNNEEDIKEINEKIQLAMKNTKKILKLYNDFSKKNEKAAQEDVNNFLKK